VEREVDWPFVSIIVPVFNGSDTIDELLRSLLALNYPQTKHEIIVVDNNSQDNTPFLSQRYPVRLLYERQMQSSYAARNRGIEAAKGEIIAFTDADCVADSDWLRRLIADHVDNRWGGFAGGFEAYPPSTDVQRYMMSTGASCFTPEFLQQPFLAPQSRGEILCSRIELLDYRASIPLPSNLVNPPTANVAYRRQLFDEIGYFDPLLTSGGDLEFAWRVQTQTSWQIKIIPEAIIYHQHRRDLASMSKQYRKNGWGYGLQVLDQAANYGVDTHRVARQMAIESLILILLSVASHATRFFARLLYGLLYSPSEELYLRAPIFTMIGSVNFYIGRLIAARKGNEWLFQELVQGV
jgi:glycosyltransferase involved in cell wall biosynthesis